MTGVTVKPTPVKVAVEINPVRVTISRRSQQVHVKARPVQLTLQPKHVGITINPAWVPGAQGKDGKNGADGAPGLAGDTNLLTVTGVAAETLSGHRVVRPMGDGTYDYASRASPSSRYVPLLLTTGVTLVGDLGQYVAAGRVIEPTWSWSQGQHIYLGVDGVLTQVPPTTGISRVVAQAIDATSLLFNPQPAFTLA